HRSVQLAHEVARPAIHPGVFVDLSPDEARPVRALLPDDLSALHESGVIDHERSALAGMDVLCVVETLCGDRSERSERTAAETGTQSVSVVFDDRYARTLGEGKKTVHVDPNASVVHDGDRARP